MNVCIVGDGLVSLTLAKVLVNQGIHVDLILDKKTKKIDKSRTLGISKANIDFFNQYILNIKKILWEINKIEIYTENLKNEKILNFEKKNKSLFSITKNYELYNILSSSLNKSIFFNKKPFKKNIYNENYNLIFNCDRDNFIAKKHFSKKFSKNYKGFAYTSIIDHNKIANNTAVQIFTKKGPLAFLPISNVKTSVVYSVRDEDKIDLEELVKKYNFKYSNIKINEVSSFKLSSISLRNYFYKNILAFGDSLHKLHPLAGQGFNMSIRDIRSVFELIKNKIDLGLDLDSSIFRDFEKKMKHKNFLFSNSIDLIYEIFKLESKINNPFLSKSIQFFGKKNYVNKFFTDYADRGIDL